jgi:hypothetical protein
VILDPQQDTAVHSCRMTPDVFRIEYVAQMQPAGGRGGESCNQGFYDVLLGSTGSLDLVGSTVLEIQDRNTPKREPTKLRTNDGGLRKDHGSVILRITIWEPSPVAR